MKTPSLTPLPTLLPEATALGLALVAWLFSSPLAYAQYKWTDAQGGVHYSDLPPPGTTRGLTRAPIPGAAPSPPGSTTAPRQDAGSPEAGSAPDEVSLQGLPGELRHLARRAPVVLYAIAACAPCDEGRALLQARGIPYSERRIESAQDQQALQALGIPGAGFPVLSAGSERAVGYEAGMWQKLLDQAGYPTQSMLPTRWRAPLARPLGASAATAPAFSPSTLPPISSGTPAGPPADGRPPSPTRSLRF
jgi:hypothetical protein